MKYVCQICQTQYDFDAQKVQYGFTSSGSKFSFMRCPLDNGYAYSDAAGATGPTGPQGPKGDKGLKGDKGEAGASVKSLKLTTTAEGEVNGGEATLTDESKVVITIEPTV